MRAFLTLNILAIGRVQVLALNKLHHLKQGFTRGPKRTVTKGPVHQLECSTLNSNVEQVLGLGLHYLASVSNSSMITVLHSRFSTKNDSIRVRWVSFVLDHC